MNLIERLWDSAPRGALSFFEYMSRHMPLAMCKNAIFIHFWNVFRRFIADAPFLPFLPEQ